MASTNVVLRLRVETDPFEIAVLQSENAMYREENRRLKVDNAELRAALKRNVALLKERKSGIGKL